MADTKISSLTETFNLEDAYLAAALSGSSVKLTLGQMIRNTLLTGCDIAKALAGYQRKLNTFFDGYKASDGVAAGSSSNYAVNTTSGYVGPTFGAGTMISQATGSSIGDQTAGGGLAAAFDGTTAQTNATAAAKNSLATGGRAYVGKNYSASAKKIQSAIYYSSTNFGMSANGAVSCTLNLRAMHTAPASANDAGSTIIGTTTFTDSNSQQTITITSTDTTTAWEYVWIELLPGGATPNSYTAELQFYPPLPNNATVVTTAQTADATVGNGRVLLEIDPIDSITLNTDLTAEVTCDNGAHWASATLSSIGKGQSGRTVVETADTSAGANTGTSFAARIKTLNNKNVNVYKTAMVVH